MANPGAWPPGTTFTSAVELDTGTDVAYGVVTVSWDPGEYPELHTADVADVADAVRDLLAGRGYTVPQFTAPVTSSDVLDWPQEP